MSRTKAAFESAALPVAISLTNQVTGSFRTLEAADSEPLREGFTANRGLDKTVSMWREARAAEEVA
jgi:hypothetical protein